MAKMFVLKNKNTGKYLDYYDKDSDKKILDTKDVATKYEENDAKRIKSILDTIDMGVWELEEA